jgi:hypothetical protein
MKNLMASGCLTRGMEINKVPDEGDAMPFHIENTVMTIHDGRPSPGVHCMSNLSLGTLARCTWGAGTQGYKDTIFQHLCTLLYVGIWI